MNSHLYEYIVGGGIVIPGRAGKTRFGDFHDLSEGRTDIPVCPGQAGKPVLSNQWNPEGFRYIFVPHLGGKVELSVGMITGDDRASPLHFSENCFVGGGIGFPPPFIWVEEFQFLNQQRGRSPHRPAWLMAIGGWGARTWLESGPGSPH